MSFVVFGLPRSRTYWLSRFLTYRDWICSHEELVRVRSLQDVRDWFKQPKVGTVETAAAPWWRLLERYAPECRIAVVRRPVAEVMDSLERLRMPMDRPSVERFMGRLDRKLDQIEKRTSAVSVTFEELKTEAGCARIFEHCLQLPFDRGWWELISSHNLQTSMEAITRYYQAYQPQLTKVALIAKHQTIASMARKERQELDGVTIQQEPFETFWRDAQALVKDHMVVVGEAPTPEATNWPLAQMLSNIGALHVMTARCNGRVFGYLVSIISPSFESRETMTALHTMFYADPSFRGLGMRLERESIESLRKLGIHEVNMRAGVRGSGPKVGALYRRMGAEPNGEFYKLDLRGI